MRQRGRFWRRVMLLALATSALAGCAQRNTEDLAMSICTGQSGDEISNLCAHTSLHASSDDMPVGSIPPSDDVNEPAAPASGDVPRPDVSRVAVMPQLVSASSDLVTTLAPNGMPTAGLVETRPEKTPPSPAARGRGLADSGALSLNDAVAVAVLSHPLMGVQAAKVSGALADRNFASGARRPMLEIFGGSGHGTTGKYDNDPKQFSSPSFLGARRSDLGVSFKQLIFDFGASGSEVARNGALIDAERLRLADQAEDIALRTINAYLNILEQREMLAIIDKTVAQQRELAALVKLSQLNGNGTKADLDHIQTKVIEIEALRSDIKTAYQNGADEFRRLTSLEPGQVRRPRSPASIIPKTPQLAIAAAQTSNPSLLALARTGASLEHQLDGVKAQSRPRVDLQGDALVKHYVGGAAAASQGVVDMRAMLMVSYKLMDGGMLAAQTERVRSNQVANDFKRLDERETIELNLRRLYQSLSANRAKRAAARNGLITSRSVNALYIDQFKAGKRTVFELLDSNMTVFAMQKNIVTGEYEEMRAIYGILRNLGRLGRTIANG